MKSVESKQEIIFGVLNQVLENLAHIRESAIDIKDLKDRKNMYDIKMEKMLHNQ
jgi:hypothetical protein